MPLPLVGLFLETPQKNYLVLLGSGGLNGFLVTPRFEQRYKLLEFVSLDFLG
jgi:hypothetical protein